MWGGSGASVRAFLFPLLSLRPVEYLDTRSRLARLARSSLGAGGVGRALVRTALDTYLRGHPS